MIEANIAPAPQAVRKYGFPRVIITGTQICCGLRPTYLDQAKQYYTDEGHAPSPYGTVQQIIFGMCYFSKFQRLHQFADRKPQEGMEKQEVFKFIDCTHMPNREKFGSMYPGGGAVNWRHWIIDQHHGLLLTHYEATCSTIQSYINANNLGTVVSTARWMNRRTNSWLNTLIWHWNGNAPTPESCGFTDFPFDMAGQKIPGRSNLRTTKGTTIPDPTQEAAAA